MLGVDLAARTRWRASLVIFLVHSVLRLPAQEPDPTIALFALNRQHRTWAIEDGLPDKRTGPVVVSREGHLWVGTFNGVTRFNGYGFQTVGGKGDPLDGMEVETMVQDHDGDLWVLSRSGKLVEVIGDRIEVRQSAGDVLGGPAARLAVAHDGVVHIVTANREGVVFFAWRSNRLERLGGESLAGHYPLSFDITEDGRIWGTFRSIGPFEFREGRIQKLDLPVKGRGSSVNFKRFNGGHALVGSGHLLVYRDGDWRLEETFTRPVPEDAEILCASDDADGTLWIGTSYRGLWARLPGDSPARVEVPSNPDAVRYPYHAVDRQGNIWSSGIGGLVQFYSTAFTPWSAPEAFRNAQLFSVAEDGRGAIGFCAYDGIFRLASNGMIERVPMELQRQSLRIIAGRRDGGFWIAEYGPGIWLTGPGGVERIGAVPGGGFVANIVDLGNDEALVASTKGLSLIGRGKAEPIDPFEPGSGSTVRHLAKGPGGAVYAAHQPFAISRWRNGAWERLADERASKGEIEEMVVDLEHGVWTRFQDGRLGWWREGVWSEIPREALGIPVYVGLAPDPTGGLWILTEREGSLRFDRRELERHLRDASRSRPVANRFGEAQGVVGCQGSPWNSGILADTRERVWIAANRGALAYDRRAWQVRREHAQPTPVVIEEVQIEEKTVPIRRKKSPPIILEPGTDRCAVSFAMPDLINPEYATYRYRLRGYDVNWIDAGRRRTAYYQRLPPGRYLFEVSGTNSLGLPSLEPATLTIIMRPLLWQRRSFHVVMGLIFAGLLFWLYRLRIRRFRRRQAIQHEFSRRLIETQELERKRIAAELHDSLGQNLTVVKNRLTLEQMDTPETASGLKDISDLVAQTIEDTRRISHNLRPYVLDRIGLTRAIEELARQIEEATGLRIEAQIDDVDNLLSTENQINLYRVIQECLNNVVKHADASKVSVSVRRHPGEVVLRVEDDGRGFDAGRGTAPVIASGGMGLDGIGERLRIMEGTVQWISAPREGVKVIARIPIPPPR